MATMQVIHAILKERFGEAIAGWSEPEAGDPAIMVDAERWLEVAGALRHDPALAFDLLRLVSAVDWTDRLSSVYHLYSFAHDHEAIVNVDLPRENPRVASVAALWPAADWHEREAYDMMGIVYEGHPELKRILLPDDWAGYPLRKDYVQPEEYHGITNQ